MKKSQFNWRHEYDIERDQQEGDACRTFNDQDSLTQQSFSIDADINVIVQRLGLDRQELPPAPIDPSYYGDVSNVPDLRAILDQANDARNRFMELPAKLRARFHNEPSELWQFVQDPENADEAVRLGLLARVPNPETPTPSGTPEGDKNTPD